VKAWHADWSSESRILAFMLCGQHAKSGRVKDNQIYVAMNMHYESLWFELPAPPVGQAWHVFANTGAAPPEDIHPPGQEPRLENQSSLLIGDRSVVILLAK
jgi:glycogen operon protein